MGALTYLYITRMKNAIAELWRNPVRAIFVAVALLIFVFGVVVAEKGSQRVRQYRNVNELYLIISGVYLLIAATVIRSGYKTGTTFFTMPDVGILFPAPIPQWKIMIYGMVRSVGAYLSSSVFLLYNYINTKNIYNVGDRKSVV